MDPDRCPEGDMKSFITRTFELLNSGEKDMGLNDSNKNVILVSGESGTGKTKFLNFLVGDSSKLVSIETEEGDYLIEDTGDDKRCIITSDTVFPKMMFDPETNTFFCDNNGWHDTREESYEISGTYLTKRVVDHMENIKLIFTINHTSVKKGIYRHSFMKTVKHMSEFMKNIEKYQSSILLLVTKVDNRSLGGVYIDNNRIRNGVANFLLGVKAELETALQNNLSNERELDEFAIKLISLLLIKDEDQYSRIGIFRRPKEPGLVNESSFLQDERKHLKRLIQDKILFSKKENDDFGYTVSDKCRNKIHYLVDNINKTVKFCLIRVNEEIKQHFSKVLDMILNTVRSLIHITSANTNHPEMIALNSFLKEGRRSFLNLAQYVRSEPNLEDLIRKLKIVIHELKIEVSEDDLIEIENNAKYFNFFQAVSAKQLITLDLDELFKDIFLYISSIPERLQDVTNGIALQVRQQIEFEFREIAEAMQYQFDENVKCLDLKETIDKINHYYNAMVQMTNLAKLTISVKELLKVVEDFSREIGINLPEQNGLNLNFLIKSSTFLRAISDVEIDFKPSAWVQPFQKVVKNLEDSKIWYKFLDPFFDIFSGHRIQVDREKYNVVNIEDWGKSGMLQGIVITKDNFTFLLEKVAQFTTKEFHDVERVALTELRLQEINQLMNLTLKHRYNVKAEFSTSSITIKADFISVKEVKACLEQNLVNGRPMINALRSGEYKILQIFVLNKIFIDENLSLPGIDLRIISPNWEIIGMRNIILDGLNGEPHLNATAGNAVGNGITGKKGEPGLPGRPGGNFFGIGSSFINESNLTVTVNGGNGGPGQSGGDGGQGTPGEDVGLMTNDDLPETINGRTTIKGFFSEEVRVWNGLGVFLPFWFIIQVFGNFRKENTIYFIHGTEGTVGGSGGDGGMGGKGGHPGNVSILDFQKDSRITVHKNKGNDGVDGSGGFGGKGGRNGMHTFATLNGVIFREWVHQFTRDAGAAADGRPGTDGLNDIGLEDPDPSLDISEPFRTINDYKVYARENLICRFKKALLLRFIDQLNDIDNMN